MSDELDPRLKSIYDEMPKDEPSSGLDQRILEAARRHSSRPGWKDWWMPLGAVAGVVAVSTLVVHWQAGQPDVFKEAVSVRPPLVDVAPPLAKQEQVVAESVPPVSEGAMPADPLAEERARAAARSAELQRLRRELGQPQTASRGTALPELPTVKLKPAEGDRADELASVPSSQSLQPAARLSRESPAAAPAATAGADTLRAMAAPVPARPAAIASVLLEGVSLGMNREDLAALGWSCSQPACTRSIDDPRQPAYWNLPVAGATQRVLFVDEAVAAMTLSQVNVAINNVKLSLERIGKPSERTCPMGAGEQLVSRQAGSMILTMWQNGDLTILGVCQAR